MYNKLKPLLVVLFIFQVSGQNLFGKEDHAEDLHSKDGKPFRVAFFLGHGYIPAAEFEGHKFAIIPTYGIDFQYWFSNKWGIGFKTDIELAHYAVPDESGNQIILRNNPLVLAIPVIYEPFGHGLNIFAAPGIELEEHHNFSVFRFGIGYEVSVGKYFDCGTELVYDLKNGNINALTWAIGVGKRF